MKKYASHLTISSANTPTQAVALSSSRLGFVDMQLANVFSSRNKMNFSARPTAAMLEKHANLPTAKQPEPDPPAVGTIWVEFCADESIGVKQMRNFMQHIDAHHFDTGIIVTRKAITASALKCTSTVKATIESFLENDLLVNITHHELVPKHVLLSAEEKKTLLERYRLKETQLPRIQTTDPVAKYLGLRRGQVVKIIRKSETAGRYASYRWCL